MAYPDNKPTGNYTLRDYDFADLDQNKLPMDEYLFKNGYKNADESEVDSVPDAHNQNWLFDILHRNLRYTLGVAEENKNLLENKIATPTSIGQVKIGYGLEISNNGTLSVTKGVAEDANIVSYDLPVGSYMLWAGTRAPEYFIEPAGQTLLRSQYPELWEFAQANNLVGKLFGEGDGSTTFTVTDIRGKFISIANSDNKVGVLSKAVLPNVTVPCQDWGVAGGAFGTAEQGRLVVGSGIIENKEGLESLRVAGRNKVATVSGNIAPENWGLKIILKALPTPPSNAVPIGTILDYTSSNVPDGYIIANGAELSRTTFNQLFQWAVANNLIKDQSTIPTTAHCYYGSGDGSTTFTIPDLRGVQKTSADLASNRVGINLGQFASYDFGASAIPDYTQGRSVGQTFTAPSDGIYYCSFYANETRPARCYVNNVEMSQYYDYEGEGGVVTSPFTLIVKKNDVVKWSHNGVRFGRFFPFKAKTSGFGAVAITPILKY